LYVCINSIIFTTIAPPISISSNLSPQLSLFVAALDATIVSTAAPTISSDLNSAAGYTWIGGAFLLANAASGPIWAKLSDIWGRRPIVLAALAMFFASSTVCATAKTMEALIVGRAFQGAAGGGLILLVHVCISDLFSLRQRSLLMGFTEGIWALAGGIGPVVGGAFASLVSWRWCCEYPFSHYFLVKMRYSRIQG
jgi:MFS family permease